MRPLAAKVGFNVLPDCSCSVSLCVCARQGAAAWLASALRASINQSITLRSASEYKHTEHKRMAIKRASSSVLSAKFTINLANNSANWNVTLKLQMPEIISPISDKLKLFKEPANLFHSFINKTRAFCFYYWNLFCFLFASSLLQFSDFYSHFQPLILCCF